MHNASKTSPMFSVEERMDMVNRVIQRYPNVEVDAQDCLLAEYARKYPGAVIVKGLRAASDFEYEFQMNLINKNINQSQGQEENEGESVIDFDEFITILNLECITAEPEKYQGKTYYDALFF